MVCGFETDTNKRSPLYWLAKYSACHVGWFVKLFLLETKPFANSYRPLHPFLVYVIYSWSMSRFCALGRYWLVHTQWIISFIQEISAVIMVSLKANRLSFIFLLLSFYLPDCSSISVMRHNTFTAFFNESVLFYSKNIWTAWKQNQFTFCKIVKYINPWFHRQGLSLVPDERVSLSCFIWKKLALTDLKISQCHCFISRYTPVMFFSKAY